MKFRIKLFIATFLIVSVGFCLGGTLLIVQNFNYSLNARINHALAEHITIKYFYETQLIDNILQGHEMSNELLDLTAEGIAERLSWSGITSFSAQYLNGTYESHYEIIRSGDQYHLNISSVSSMLNTNYCVTSTTDITAVYAEFSYQIRNMMLTNAMILVFLAVALYILSLAITRPISKLSKAAERIASGNYGERVTMRGDDEVAALHDLFRSLYYRVYTSIRRCADLFGALRSSVESGNGNDTRDFWTHTAD